MRVRNQRLTVILVPQGGAKTYSFEVRVPLLAGVGALLLVLLALSMTFVFSYARLIATSRTKDKLEHRVGELQEQLGKMGELQHRLAATESIRAQVLTIMGARTAALDTLRRASGSGATAASAMDEMRLREQDFARSVPRAWPARGPLTRRFQAGAKDARDYHPGIDIAAATGTAVLAAAAGTVSFAGWDPEYGYLVVLEHGLGFETRYGHNVRLSVGVGDRVERGQLIAAAGNTGRSSAPHLHFEIRKDGSPVDPGQYLP